MWISVKKKKRISNLYSYIPTPEYGQSNAALVLSMTCSLYAYTVQVEMRIFSKVTLKNFLFFWFYVGFSIVPHPDWVLQVGIEYEVSVQIYNADDRKIFISDVSDSIAHSFLKTHGISFKPESKWNFYKSHH